ncbi:HAD family hydrolase [Akkermansiaceae bacterium]|nr:HAD family hydrolase [Akkermansiaceae bacterium]
MLNTYKNWIFDWSGTLVDDTDKVVDATNHVMSHHNKPLFDRESFKRSFRLPYTEWYAEILTEGSLPEVEALFREGFKASSAEIPVLPHAREFLTLLKEKQHRIFACTSVDTGSFTEHAEDNGLLPFFEKPYSGVLDKRELIAEILESNGLKKSETIFIGDMIHDIDTAHHGGIDSLAVLTGYNTKAELESAKPTYLLEDYSSLL